MKDRMFSKYGSPFPEKAEIFLPSLSFAEDYSQIVIKQIIAKYLTKQNREPTFIAKFEKGYCQGFICVGLYALWLSTQEELRGNTVRDDWDWLTQAMHQLHLWSKNPQKESVDDIERLIALIEYFQNIDQYISVAQGDIAHSLVDTMARSPIREYSIAGLFTHKDLCKQIYVPRHDIEEKHIKSKTRKSHLLEEIVKKNRLVLISGAAHEMGVILINNMYIIFDANFPSLIKLVHQTDIDQLAREIFWAQAYQTTKASPLGFRIFSFNKEHEYYPSQSSLLDAAKAKLMLPQSDYTSNCTALHIAAWIGCEESLKYYIIKNSEVDALTLDDQSTPLTFASLNGHNGAVKLLLEGGAKIEQKDNEEKTPLDRALENRHYDTAKLFTLFASTPKKRVPDSGDAVRKIKPKNQS